MNAPHVEKAAELAGLAVALECLMIRAMDDAPPEDRALYATIEGSHAVARTLREGLAGLVIEMERTGKEMGR